MKPTIAILLLALAFQACGPMHNLQKVESHIPCIGAIGKQHSKLFSKDFQKVGEPALAEPIAVSLQSLAFTSATQTKYTKHRERLGIKTKTAYSDTSKVDQRYFQIQITDAVGLTTQLNSSTNQTVKDYLKEDKDLVLLTGISFVTDEALSHRINTAEHYFINQGKGGLTLELHGDKGTSTIKMSSLQVFDFETSGLCWKLNKRGELEIAALLMDGSSCPGETEKDPNKLDRTKAYLKL